MASPTPACRGALRFLRSHKHNLGALTGQDTRALTAIAHCWDLVACADEDGREATLEAVRCLLRAMQPSTRYLAKEAIAYVLDEADVERIWSVVDHLGAR